MMASVALKPLPVLPARKAASRGAACRATPVVRASLKSRPAKVRLLRHARRVAPAAGRGCGGNAAAWRPRAHRCRLRRATACTWG